MQIVYGDISLGICSLKLFEEEAVYDKTGTDLLMTRYSIAVQAVVNGQVEVRSGLAPTSYVDNGFTVNAYDNAKTTKPSDVVVPPAPGDKPLDVNIGTFQEAVGVPVRAGSVDPLSASAPSKMVATQQRFVSSVTPAANAVPLSYNIIADRLRQPRLRLFVFTEDGDAESLLLMSPVRWDYFCDAKNGPTPKLLSISAVHGDSQTFIVEWQVETFVAAVNADATAPPALLSNRFSCTHLVDGSGKLTIQVEGEARFRTDLLYKTGEGPDTFRVNLFQPIPRFFTREQIRVTPFPDETGVTYSYVDVEQPIRFAAGPYAGAMSIHVDHQQSLDTGVSLAGSAIDLYRNYVGVKANEAMYKHKPDANPFGRFVGWKGPKLTP